MIPMKITVSTCHPTGMIPMDEEFQIGDVGAIIRYPGLGPGFPERHTLWHGTDDFDERPTGPNDDRLWQPYRITEAQ